MSPDPRPADKPGAIETLLTEQMSTPRCEEIIERTVWTRGWRLQTRTRPDVVCAVTWDRGSGPTVPWLPEHQRRVLQDGCLREAQTILDAAGYTTLLTQRALLVLRSKP